jgi:hypothetical protein
MRTTRKKETNQLIVNFALLGANGAVYEEPGLEKIIRSGRLPGSAGDFDGLLRLIYPAQKDLVLHDDLHGLIPRACVEAVLGCIREGKASFAMSTYFQQIAFTVENGTVRISDDTKPPFEDFTPRVYPKKECFASLIACARRFETFLSRLVKKDSQWTEALERLRKGLAELGDSVPQ